MAKRPVVGAFCLAMLVSSSSWAATIEPGQGNLSINQGQGFQPVNSRIDASVGDSVMVGPNGSATVVYDDGCKVNVQPGAVTSIAPLSPCASGSFAQDNNNNNGPDWGAIGLGLLALGAIGGGIYAVTTSGNTNGTAASP